MVLPRKRTAKPNSPPGHSARHSPPHPATAAAQKQAGVDGVYGQIQAILAEARSQAWRAVNWAMVAAYWEIGRVIVEEEQRGKERADYGECLVVELSARLKLEFGKGFDRSNLWHMRSFFSAFQFSTHCVENCPGPTIASC